MRRFYIILSCLFAFNTCFQSTIDSSLTKNKYSEKQMKTIIAHMQVESSNNDKAWNRKTDAVGVLQIRPILVREVNRLYGTNFTYKDRWNRWKSYQMFCLIQNHYNPKWELEKAARIWNGGPDGMKKPSTKKYYRKVKSVYNSTPGKRS